MRARPRRIVLHVGIAFLACATPTQITVSVAAPDTCRAITTVAVSAGDPSAPPEFTARQDGCTDPANAGSLVVVPSGSKDAPIEVQVLAALNGATIETCRQSFGKDCVLAKRRLRFQRHTRLGLPIALASSCAGNPCTPDSTCVAGACRSSEVDPARCQAGVCGDDTLGASDAGAPDGGPPPPPSDGGSELLYTSIDPTNPGIHSLQVSGDYVYWTENSGGAIGRGLKDGGTPDAHFLDTPWAPVDLAVVAPDIVAFTRNGIAVSVNLDTSGQYADLAGGSNIQPILYAPDGRLFVADHGAGTFGGSLSSIQIGFPPLPQTFPAPFVLASGLDVPIAIRLVGKLLYFAESGIATVSSIDVTNNNAVPVKLVTGLEDGQRGDPVSLDVDATTLYVVTDHALFTAPIAGGPPTARLTSLGQGGTVRVDSGNAYFVDYGTGELERWSPDGTTTTLAADVTKYDGSAEWTTRLYEQSIAIDGAYVYYLAVGAKQIRRVPK